MDGFPSFSAHLLPMRSEQRADALVLWAPAKVNLFLEILGKRPDGYHELETLMVTVSLDDELVFKEESSGDILLSCDRPELSTGPDNLIRKAADLVRRRTGCARGARIELTKRIPMAAGLAGGSSDAAATLAGLNRLWALKLSSAELTALGAELGSDVPFFFAGPAAWCMGRGEIVTPLRPGTALPLVLINPPIGLSTAAVYRAVRVPERPVSGEAIRRAFEAGDLIEVGRHLHNRLQEPAESLCPLVATIRQRVESLDPAGQRMSGSGSSYFALGRDAEDARRIATALSHGWDEEVRPRVSLVTGCLEPIAPTAPGGG
jgi:4-diphosphocytidyl-2-C-methyl-D-erythritol kinase